ncbi:Nop14-like protein [Hortaea werneckii]|nr:Nop14-like protein [Hortaea werneckii]KAI6878556.1 Nop14-like protein [Hortaea werneckii]KAI6988380.1 Nop14-like protein [Hortaea werneckii]KAI7082759.1 Nop14-like protein [Hortaea werneckii]KAI7142113.1 Nop14-like protein [Hortaea werneckii]
MPPSQLKSLKKSLHDQGIVGPQKSKKQKKAQKGNQSHQQDRAAALQSIRDSFNPFELRQASRPAKFDSVSHASANRAAAGGKYKDVLHRPGASKSAGEEMRRRQLLPEMQRRSKVGGLVDRRIGEGDPGMTAEERAVQRFAREKSGKGGRSMFDLEGSDDDEPTMGLTHGGRSLNDLQADDFGDMSGGEDGSGSEDEGFMRRKRRRSNEDEMNDTADAEPEPERKKTKKEVMEEVIAKSKMHKYERQKAKENDEDLRDELDSGMQDMLALLRGHKPAPKQIQQEAEAALANGDGPAMNPDRQRLLDGMDRSKADKEYEVRLRQLAQDTRAKPSDRTKTAEEKAKDQALRLKELEDKRAKRMRGEPVSDDEDEDAGPAGGEKEQSEGERDAFGNDEVGDEAAEFGLASTLPAPKRGKDKEKVQHDDEDEFDVDEDLIASGSDVDVDQDSELSDESSDDDEAGQADPAATRDEEEDDEFVKGVFGPDAAGSQPALTGANGVQPSSKPTSSGLAFTYPCPRTHAELLDVVKDIPVTQLPTVVQRIRALHHPSLSASNKESMSDFSAALVDHIAYLGNTGQPLAVVEQVIRHIHSLSRTYPTEIAEAFRKHLLAAHEQGDLRSGDLIILTAIGSIYPTSDHFHQVVTPAITLMGKWLGLNAPDTAERRATGAFVVALCVKYQVLAKRYVPEAMRFVQRTLSVKPSLSSGELRPHLDNLLAMADLWKEKTAFPEIFAPFTALLKSAGAKKDHQTLTILLQQAYLRRRPLELHHHRKQPIPTRIPKFEESFNPDKHYDPDKERSDAAKLQKEYKRERKGALRELRKDANFVAREQLREKREKDAEYERKHRRIIAEIQGEEGREAKEYEREKAQRKRARG